MKKNPKIALINPGKSARFAVQEPLNLGFIAAYLEKHNYEVRIIDQLAGENIEEELQKYKPDIAGITGTTPIIYDAYEIAALTKKMGILTVIGGVHATIFPEEAIQHADMVVKGEGERAMLKILNENITSGIVSAPFIENLDEIPIPARHLMKMEKYLYCKKNIPYIGHLPYASGNDRIVHMLTSRCCSHGKCIFCHNTWRNMPHRMDSPEKIISEIKSLKDNYRIDAIYYVEDNFFSSNERVVKLCELILKNGYEDILWGGSARADCVDPEVMKLAKKAGCRSITIGVESGSQRIIDILKKDITIEMAKKAIQTVKDAGLIAHANFIIGNPTETEEDIQATKDFIRETNIVFPEIYLFTPYPGSQAWRDFKAQGLLPEKNDWSVFTQEKILVNATTMSTNRLDKLRAQLYMGYFLRHPKTAFVIIFWALTHPSAMYEKIIKTFLPFFKVGKQ
ncbi:MAG: hypothetical protein A3J83_02135 [Elusimicrobia bacterium RIFOXYA2_FULL_40_6]|nr:MAG: hypothetical protein A3J83_02135 [Elusimicrobia bacterium RIFOXYA2_FULL_40_6]